MSMATDDTRSTDVSGDSMAGLILLWIGPLAAFFLALVVGW